MDFAGPLRWQLEEPPHPAWVISPTMAIIARRPLFSSCMEQLHIFGGVMPRPNTSRRNLLSRTTKDLLTQKHAELRAKGMWTKATTKATEGFLEFRLPELIPDALLILNQDVGPAQDVPRLLRRRLANVGGEPFKAHDREDHLVTGPKSFWGPSKAHRKILLKSLGWTIFMDHPSSSNPCEIPSIGL